MVVNNMINIHILLTMICLNKNPRALLLVSDGERQQFSIRESMKPQHLENSTKQPPKMRSGGCLLSGMMVGR